MGSTLVYIGERGFWMRDGILELWLRFLALHIEDPVESGSLAFYSAPPLALARRPREGGSWDYTRLMLAPFFFLDPLTSRLQ